nr:G-protein coupled receptor GRL101-like [Lytechinus pictus]
MNGGGVGCVAFAGFLSFLSSESSVFLIVLISWDCLSCRVPLLEASIHHLYHSSLYWGNLGGCHNPQCGISVLLTVLDPDAYDLSDVCVGLPLIRKNINLQAEVDKDILNTIGIEVKKVVAGSSASTWQYSVAVFLGINFICFTIILVAYIAIFAKVRFSRAAVGQKGYSSNEIRMALKLSLIVATDFFCWMPIIILGIIVQSDHVVISADVYAWLIALVLPINSAINPYLYTIVDHYVGQDKSSHTSGGSGGSSN